MHKKPKIMEKILEKNHEKVLFFEDKKAKFEAIIAIHNSNLGSALGGIRYYPYIEKNQALQDVLRLSEAMSYKSALANLNLGGGKMVVFQKENQDFKLILEKIGLAIDTLKGSYFGAEDIGINTESIGKISEKTNFVTGKPDFLNGSGNPAPFTALGIFLGIKACLNFNFKSDSLRNFNVLVEGIGQVGSALIEHLVQENAQIYVKDLDQNKIKKLQKKYPEIKNFDLEKPQKLDLYSPCALGASVNPKNIANLQPKMIIGGANNQLFTEDFAEVLLDKKIIYLPDFLVNAGGVINCAEELNKNGYHPENVIKKVNFIYEKSLEILEKSAQKKVSAQKIALNLAKERILNAKKEEI